MEFTYKSLKALVDLLDISGYCISDYHTWQKTDKCVILRHDIDYDISKSVDLAYFEKEIGVNSTYFVLLTSDFYNVFSKSSCEKLKCIISCGHEIGLHFDEVRYPELVGNIDKLREKIIKECELLEEAVGQKISTISMHRPSKTILEANLQIPGIINSYGNDYFKGFKYISDSRRNWREPVEEIIKSRLYNRLHILTHAFWYSDVEKDIHSSISEFVNNALMDRYTSLEENITNLGSIMDINEITRK